MEVYSALSGKSLCRLHWLASLPLPSTPHLCILIASADGGRSVDPTRDPLRRRHGWTRLALHIPDAYATLRLRGGAGLGLCHLSFSAMAMKGEDPAVSNFREYLRIPSVHPNVNYGKASTVPVRRRISWCASWDDAYKWIKNCARMQVCHRAILTLR